MAPTLEKYKDRLPVPRVVHPVGTKNGQPYYELEIDRRITLTVIGQILLPIAESGHAILHELHVR